MNYPIWEIPHIGGGLLIAIIAILHVFISHLAVGGGLFLVLTERKAIRSGDNQLLEYVKSHTLFFLLLTMVFGGISGVGIWFIIALVSPEATSVLIHNFVFGWAIEWVFFIGEIVALLFYHYRFGKINDKDHMKLGWLYFAFAWLSLFIINGIIGFMLTPGHWVETGNFWHGFFNPTFFSSLIFRSGIAFMFAGLFGLVTAVFTKDEDFKSTLYKHCLRWMYISMVVVISGGIWYYFTTPGAAQLNLFKYNPAAKFFVNTFIISSIVFYLLALLFLLKSNKTFQIISVFVLIAVGLSWMGGFEYMREMARKPYVLNEILYSNSIFEKDVEKLNSEGFLKHAKWARFKEVTKKNQLVAGEDLFRLQCMACHTFNGYNDIIKRTNQLTERGLEAKLTGLGKVNNYMPPFVGTQKELEALAAYLYQDVHKNPEEVMEKAKVKEYPFKIPEFNSQEDDYVLLVWNDLGMHCISDNDKYFSFLPPANTIWAQLIKRGEVPVIVTENIEISYEVQLGFENPENHVPFWDYADKVFNANLETGVGLAGKKVNGTMEPTTNNAFVAHHIPVVPYMDNGNYNPYPLFKITAKNKETGEKLMSTIAVAPTSTEMGCRNCHQGDWRWDNTSGIADLTAKNILAVHDRMNKTNLLEEAEAGNPKLCQSCHADPAIGAEGKHDVLNFSTAIHGFHANYLTGLEDQSCNLCHPSHSKGRTQCFRGYHNQIGLNCTDCHGPIEDHAIGLVNNEIAERKFQAERLINDLQPRNFESKDQIKPRVPWLKEPDCLGCHKDFDVKQFDYVPSPFNNWTDGGKGLYRNRTDKHGVMCSACHGSTHAIYFADNIYGADRDNIQPLQYQGVSGTIGTNGNCKVCHKKEMTRNAHHRNMLGKDQTFREKE
jgi:cbb3-type cytochrome c oxidase subunit III